MTAVASERAAPIAHKQVLVVFSGLVLAMLLAAHQRPSRLLKKW